MLELNGDLLSTINSPGFDAFQCIDYLRRHSHNIGIHNYLVKKLRSYTYDELEFFIPQLIQLVVSFETDSMALEEFLLDYSGIYPHFSLIVFWNLQAYIFELRNDPESYSFQTIRKFINKLQDILFNTETPDETRHEYRENLQPSLILAGAMAASFGLPQLQEYALPLIKTQAKQQKSFVFKLANFQKTLTRNLTNKNKRISSDTSHKGAYDEVTLVTNSNLPNSKTSEVSIESAPRSPRRSANFLSDDSEANTTDEDIEAANDTAVLRKHRSLDLKHTSSSFNSDTISDVVENLRINTTIKSKKTIKSRQVSRSLSLSNVYLDKLTDYSQSMPDLTHIEKQSGKERPDLYPTDSESVLSLNTSYSPHDADRRVNMYKKPPTFSNLRKTLQVNYSKKETDFMMSLQNISLRLSQVPKEARLSALRAELSIINDNILPSEIDIPQLLPITSNKNKKYHKILRLSVNDACVLNSAERVPYLLYVEYLSDEIDFNPFSEQNQIILASRASLGENKPKVSSNDLMNVIESTTGCPSNNENTVIDQRGKTEGMSETDLGDISILSRKSSGHDLNRIKLIDNNSIDGLKTEPLSPKLTSEIPTKVLADQMRIASVMLQQLESSGQASSDQSVSIRSRIVESMISLQDQFDSINYDKLNQLRGDDQDAGERKLENDFKLGEDWATKKMRIKNSSIYGHLANWELCSVIAKNGDDLPQEAFACQLISMISTIWRKNHISAWTKRMKILITSANAGLVETITNAISIHSIKKSLTEISISQGENAKGRIFTLQDYFIKIYGDPTSSKYRKAQDNFARSLASYSVICYVLQIKDRHNGNIMLDNEGHIIHIDFGFLLSNSPGSVGFEAAPFKLTAEYLDLMGGLNSPVYEKFKKLCRQCFDALRKNSDQIVNIVELMQKDSNLPCFKSGENTSVLLKQRLQLNLTDEECANFVEFTLIGKSLGSMYTRLYDQFQMVTQGIYS